MNAARFAWAFVFVACGGTTATSSNDGGGSTGDGSSSEAGDSTAPGVVPDAFVSAGVGTGPDAPAAVCPLGDGGLGSFLALGVEEAGRPATVADGASLGGETVHVACSVTPVGGGYDVVLGATWPDPHGGTLTVSSPAGQGAVTASGGSGISATFQNPSLAYQANDCTIAFTYGGDPVPSVPSVTAGRIWAHVSCLQATASAGSGGTCDAEADFLFEQCGQ